MIKIGSYVGNNRTQYVSLPFSPEAVIVKGGSTAARVFMKDSWVGRTMSLASAASSIGGVRRHDKYTGFWVGSNADMNTTGVTYYYMALARSAELPFSIMSWMGNGAAGHVVPLPDQITPVASIIKRDGNLPAAVTLTVGTTQSMTDGSALASGVTAHNAGSVTLGTSTSVNELTPPDSGEGIDGIFFPSSPYFTAASYVGDGRPTQTISVGFRPIAAIIMPPSAAARFVTAGMSNRSGPVTASAISTADDITFTDTGFTTTFNTASSTYRYIVLADHQGSAIAPDLPNVVGRTAYYLHSREVNSFIDCGTSNTLKLAGTISIEWFGSLDWLDADRSAYGSLIIRGGTTQAVGDVANSHNWGLLALAPNDNTLDWAGPQIGVVVADRYILTGDVRKTWRTGIMIPRNEFVHWLVTHDGAGKWRLYRNGRLVKARNIDMVTASSLGNIVALTSRSTVIGATDSSGTKVGSQRMTFISARIYSKELLAAEVLARFRREAQQRSDIPDVADALIEEWKADNQRGGTLPATLNSGNNGTTTTSSVITLTSAPPQQRGYD